MRIELFGEAQRDFQPRVRTLAVVEMNDDGFVAHGRGSVGKDADASLMRE
jgi:hypothetical protein